MSMMYLNVQDNEPRLCRDSGAAKRVQEGMRIFDYPRATLTRLGEGGSSIHPSINLVDRAFSF
ncbi:MAG: hypothetical protein GY859_09395 [Desulfobacterales bacterium]|nr:hypothetical protein [Desulfobacterales bacterium]